MALARCESACRRIYCGVESLKRRVCVDWAVFKFRRGQQLSIIPGHVRKVVMATAHLSTGRQDLP